jgi:hypothetical protein
MKLLRSIAWFLVICVSLVGLYEFAAHQLGPKPATAGAPSTGFNQMIVGVSDAGKQVPILVDPSGAPILSGTGMMGASFSGFTMTVAGITDAGVLTPFLVDTSGGLILSGLTPPVFSGQCALSSNACTVVSASVQSTSNISVAPYASGGTAPCYVTISAGVNFVITCPGGTGQVAWMRQF